MCEINVQLHGIYLIFDVMILFSGVSFKGGKCATLHFA